MKSTAKREVMTGVITFLVYGILGFAASVLTSLPEAGLDSLAASHAVFIIGSIASFAVLVGGIAFGIVFGRKRSNGYLIGLVASVVFFLSAGFGFFYTLSSIGVIDIHDIRFQSLYEPSITIIIAYAVVPYISYAAARIKASKRKKLKLHKSSNAACFSAGGVFKANKKAPR